MKKAHRKPAPQYAAATWTFLNDIVAAVEYSPDDGAANADAVSELRRQKWFSKLSRVVWDTMGRRSAGGKLPDAAERLAQHPDGVLLIMELVAAGFTYALRRYEKDLRGNVEAMSFIHGRKPAGDRGREKRTARKVDNAAKAQALFAQGRSVDDIALAINRKKSTVYELLKQPTATKKTTRRR